MSLIDKFDDIPLEELYEWLDDINLSRARSRSISRDFSDGVLMAEVLKHFYPRSVELHNYSPANSLSTKLGNWITLNNKVLKKLDLMISHEKITALATAVPGAIEDLLKEVRRSLDRKIEQKSNGNVNYIDMFVESNQQIGKTEIDWDKIQKEFNILLYENKKLKTHLKDKEECIEILKQKLSHLEAMLELKNQRITDLGKQLDRLPNQNGDCKKSVSGMKIT